MRDGEYDRLKDLLTGGQEISGGADPQKSGYSELARQLTQQEIANVVGPSRPRVEQIVNDSFREFSKTINEMLSKGFTISEIMTRKGWKDETLLWSLSLQDEPDDVKMVKYDRGDPKKL